MDDETLLHDTLVRGLRMSTAARHQEISDEFEKGDLVQASEKVWGAVAHYVKSVARKHGWPNRSHPDVRKNATRLIDLTDNPRQNGLLFKSMENPHINFYQDTYADRPQDVKFGIKDARTLVAAMKTAESRLPGR